MHRIYPGMLYHHTPWIFASVHSNMQDFVLEEWPRGWLNYLIFKKIEGHVNIASRVYLTFAVAARYHKMSGVNATAQVV